MDSHLLFLVQILKNQTKRKLNLFVRLNYSEQLVWKVGDGNEIGEHSCLEAVNLDSLLRFQLSRHNFLLVLNGEYDIYISIRG